LKRNGDLKRQAFTGWI